MLVLPGTRGQSAIVGPRTPNMLNYHFKRTLLAHGHLDVCVAFKTKVLPSVANKK